MAESSTTLQNRRGTTPKQRDGVLDVAGDKPQPAGLPLDVSRMLQMQRMIGNRALTRMIQREIAPDAGEAQGGVAVAQRQPTPVQLPLFKAGDYVSAVVEGQIEYPDPHADPNAPSPVLSAGDFGHTLKKGAVEFSASLMKVPNPLDETVNEWLGLGQNVKVSSSLTAFKLAADTSMADLKDVDVSVNLGEIELALSGKFDHTTMQTSWGQKLFGGTALGRAMSKKTAVFVGTIKLSLALPAEDALRLAQIAAHHKQLRAMAFQNKVWLKHIRDLKGRLKQLEAAWKTADGFTRINLAKQFAEVRSGLKALGKKVAKNKKLARRLLGEAVRWAKAMSAVLKKTLARFVPILNAYFLVTDTIKAIEVIYGLITGKGYSFGGEEGGSGEGEEAAGGGAASKSEGTTDEAGTTSGVAGEDAEFAGLEDQAAGGGDEYSQPVVLNPNAALVFEILKDRTGSKLGSTDLAALDSIVPADMNAQDMERLLSALQTSKLSSKPFKALTQVMTLAKRARDAAAVDPDKAGGSGGGTGGGVGQGVGPGEGGEEQGGEVESENDQTYDETPANSQQTEQVELDANEQQPESPNPVPKENGQAAPPQIDPDIRAFMTRALAAIEAQGLGGYAEFDGGVSYNALSIGDVFNGKAAVQVATQVPDAEGQVTTQDVWYGGEAKFKVLAKLPNGQLDVIRSVMQAYNKYGRFVGTVAAARMTVGYQGELQLEP